MSTRTGLTGDFSGLAALKSRVRGLATPEFRKTLSLNLAQAARKQILDGFEQKRDPYGTPWKPSASKRAGAGGNSSPILADSARLRNSIAPQSESAVGSEYKVTDRGFRIGTNVLYAAIHQYGGVIRPKKETVKTITRKRKDGTTTTYQQRFRGLRFKVVKGHSTKTRRAQYSDWIIVQKVTMPKRPYFPTRGLGPIWGSALRKQALAIIRSELSAGSNS